eukprot:5391678-Amphidinium_carterae.1
MQCALHTPTCTEKCCKVLESEQERERGNTLSIDTAGQAQVLGQLRCSCGASGCCSKGIRSVLITNLEWRKCVLLHMTEKAQENTSSLAGESKLVGSAHQRRLRSCFRDERAGCSDVNSAISFVDGFECFMTEGLAVELNVGFASWAIPEVINHTVSCGKG